MGNYTLIGPFVNGSAPALSATNMDTIDNGIDDAHDELNTIYTTPSRPLAVPGTLTTGTDKLSLEPDSGPWDIEVIEIVGRVKTAPTGASLLFTVTYDEGAGDVSLPQCTIAGGTKRGSVSVPNTSVGDGAFFQVNIDQVGSTVAGENLMIDVWYRIRPQGAVVTPRTP